MRKYVYFCLGSYAKNDFHKLPAFPFSFLTPPGSLLSPFSSTFLSLYLLASPLLPLRLLYFSPLEIGKRRETPPGRRNNRSTAEQHRNG